MTNLKYQISNKPFCYSIIRNKCGTFATAPRIDGVSGRSTT